MAAGDITVRIDSETKAFRQGVESGIIAPLEDAEKALDDLGKSNGPADLERDLKRAQNETEQLADETKKTARQIEDSYRTAGRDIKKGVGDGLKDAKDEARQSGREAAASFSGEWDDVGDFVQETVANGLGPAGIAGGALIGAVVATATQSVDAWNDKIQGIQDATAEMWQNAAAEGQKFVDGEAVRAEATRILWDKSYEAQFAAAEKAGVDRADLAVAIATGEGEAYDRVHQQLMDAYDAEGRKVDENYDKYAAAGEGGIQLESSQAQEIARTIDILDAKGQAVDDNKRRAADAADAEKVLQEQTRDQIDRTARAAQERYEGLAATYGKPIQTTIKVNVDDAAAWARLAKLTGPKYVDMRVKPRGTAEWE